MKNDRVRKVIAAARERVIARNSSRHWTLEKVYEEAREELKASGVEDVIDALVWLAVKEDDRECKRQANEHQLDLLSGDEAAYEGAWVVEDRKRVQVRDAVRPDVENKEIIKETNLARQVASRKREREVTAAYFPYMTDDKVTVPQAVARWREANGK